jgi:hypothetical protein
VDKSRNPVILSIMRPLQNPLESTIMFGSGGIVIHLRFRRPKNRDSFRGRTRDLCLILMFHPPTHPVGTGISMPVKCEAYDTSIVTCESNLMICFVSRDMSRRNTRLLDGIDDFVMYVVKILYLNNKSGRFIAKLSLCRVREYKL